MVSPVRMIWLGLGLAVVMVLTGCGVWTSTPGNVGDCAKLKDMSRGKTEMTKVDCKSPEAMYQLVDTVSGRSPSCPRGDYAEDTSIRNRKTERRTRQCFVLNVKEGECLRPVGDSYERAPCGGTSVRISKIVNGQFDAKLCAAGEDAKVYSRPATTICITR